MGFLNCASYVVGGGWIQEWCEKRYEQIRKNRFVCQSRKPGKIKI